MAAVKTRFPVGIQVDGNAVFDTTTLVVDGTNNRVGIGTATPTKTLDIMNAGYGLTIDADGFNSQLRHTTPSDDGYMSLYGSKTGGAYILLYGSAAGVTPNRLTLNGLMTINTTDIQAYAMLTTVGSSSSEAAMLITSGGAPTTPTSGMFWNQSGALKFRDASTTQTVAFLSNRLDQFAAPTSSVSMNSQKITNLLDPTSAQDAATKAYVDAIAAGVDIKPSVRAISRTNITLSAPQTIDGVAIIAGDRVLVAGQTFGENNGIYVCAAGPWSRATDSDTSAEVTAGMYTFVSEGTTYGNTGWVLTTDDAITLGTTPLVFTQYSGAGAYTAGAGLTQSGTTFAVGAGTGITVNADDVALTIPVAVTSGGTGQSSALTQYGVVYGSSTTAMAVTAAPGSAIKALVGSATVPVWTAAASAAYQTLRSNSANTALEWSTVDLGTTGVSGTLATNKGGTGQNSSLHNGGVIYANSTSSMASTGLGGALTVLIGGGGVPSWGAVALGGAMVSGTLTADKGGTGQSSYTVGDLLYASGATALSKLADVAVGSFLVSGGVGVAPAWSSSPSSPTFQYQDSDSTTVVGATKADQVTLSTLTQTAIMSLASATYRTVRYVIQVVETASTPDRIMCVEIVAIHDGTTVTWTEYGKILALGSAEPATFSLDINTGNIRLLVTGATANATTYNVVATALVA